MTETGLGCRAEGRACSRFPFPLPSGLCTLSKLEGGRDEIPALLELILQREELETTGKKPFLLHRTEKRTGAGPGGAGEGARADAPRAGSWFEAEGSNGKTGGAPADETLRGHPGDTQHRNQSRHVWAVP